jgi:hypothetical protein
MDFVDACAYLRQISRRPRIVSFGSMIIGSGRPMRQLLQFGALGF